MRLWPVCDIYSLPFVRQVKSDLIHEQPGFRALLHLKTHVDGRPGGGRRICKSLAKGRKGFESRKKRGRRVAPDAAGNQNPSVTSMLMMTSGVESLCNLWGTTMTRAMMLLAVACLMVAGCSNQTSDTSITPSGDTGASSEESMGEPGGGPGGGGGGRGSFDPAQIFAERDTDGDGKLTGEEISERMREGLAETDTDGDGAVTLEEFQARMQQFRGGRGRGGRGGFDPSQFFQDQDADGDGKLAGEEIPERMRERVADIDKDGDDAITLEEFQERMQSRFGGGGRPGGRGEEGPGRPDRPQRPAGDEGSDQAAAKEEAATPTEDEPASPAEENPALSEEKPSTQPETKPAAPGEENPAPIEKE